MNYNLGVLEDNRSDDDKLADFKYEEVAMGTYQIPVKQPKMYYYYPYNQSSSLSCVAGGGAITIEYYDGNVISRRDIYNRRVNYPGGGMIGVDLLKIMAKGACEEKYMFSQGLGETGMNARDVITTDIIASRANNKTGVYFTFDKPDFDKLAEQVTRTPVVAFFYFHENGREWLKEVPNILYDFKTPTDQFTTRHQMCIVDAVKIGNTDYLIVQDTAGVGTGFGENNNLRYISREFASKRLYWAGYALNDLDEPKLPVRPVFAVTVAMKVGSKGENVKQLQEVLMFEGLLKISNATGIFGGMTRDSVKKYQEKYISEILTPLGLKSGTGIAGLSTLRHMRNKYK